MEKIFIELTFPDAYFEGEVGVNGSRWDVERQVKELVYDYIIKLAEDEVVKYEWDYLEIEEEEE